jgi:tetratricopeptide (TPR) repeat protein
MGVKGLFAAAAVIGITATSGFAWSDPPQAPLNVKAEPSSPQSARLSSRAASAEMRSDPQASLALAERAIKANPRDPWGYYDKGAALGRLGNVDGALKAFASAEERFALGDQWGRSVAIYGRAHALAEAKRCDEARPEFARYASLIRERDSKSAGLAMRYATDCKSPAEAPLAASSTEAHRHRP